MQSRTKPRRAVAVLKLPEPVPALVTYVVGIVTAMTGNPRGAVALRDEKRAALLSLLEQLRAYVQA